MITYTDRCVRAGGRCQKGLNHHSLQNNTLPVAESVRSFVVATYLEEIVERCTSVVSLCPKA